MTRKSRFTNDEPASDVETLTFRLRSDLRKELERIAEYEGHMNLSELVRACLKEKVARCRRGKAYLAWVEQNVEQTR